MVPYGLVMLWALVVFSGPLCPGNVVGTSGI